MTTQSEDTLYSSLIDVEALEQIARIGLAEECIPTPAMRPVVAWALDYYYRTDQRQAPSREALFESWRQVIEDAEVEIADTDVQIDDIQWAIKSLKAHYAMWKFQQWQKESAEAIASSTLDDRLTSLEGVTHSLVQVTLSLRDLTSEVEGMDGFRRSLAEYRKREADGATSRGITFGIQAIDEYTYGIHEGELAVIAAGPKTGKSVAFAYILLNEWEKGRRTTLFTLENSVQMTYDRLVCMKLGIDHDLYREGKALPDDVERVEIFLRERQEELEDLIRVIQPKEGERTVTWITRKARSVRSDSLLIDQLTFLEPSHRSLRGPEKIGDIMRGLKNEISGGNNPLPTLLAHQINREGIKEAEKKGWLKMYMLAEGSEVERTADWVFGLYASPDEQKAQMLKWQTMATRRGSTYKNFRMAWRPWVNQVEALGEIEMTA